MHCNQLETGARRSVTIPEVHQAIARDLSVGQTALAWGTLKSKGPTDDELFQVDNIELLLVSKRPEAAGLPRFKFMGRGRKLGEPIQCSRCQL